MSYKRFLQLQKAMETASTITDEEALANIQDLRRRERELDAEMDMFIALEYT